MDNKHLKVLEKLAEEYYTRMDQRYTADAVSAYCLILQTIIKIKKEENKDPQVLNE